MAITLFYHLQPVSEMLAGLFDHIPIQNCLACLNVSLQLLLGRQPDVVKLALQVPNQAKIIEGQVEAVGRPYVPGKKVFGGLQPGVIGLDLVCMSLHHQLPDPPVSNLLLATGKAMQRVHRPPHDHFWDFEVPGKAENSDLDPQCHSWRQAPDELALHSSWHLACFLRPSGMPQDL